jgi:hypothetical protein
MCREYAGRSTRNCPGQESQELTKTKIIGFNRTEVLAPLVIGITGHRDLREETVPQLEQKIKEIFLQLHKDYPATPLVLISALAEGADRLAAEVALSPHLGVRLIVPLPMPVDLYEQDFDRVSVLETPLGAVVVEDSTREEFRALLGRAANCIVLDLAKGNTLESISRPGPERDRQYELVGRYIAQQSQILIALWDGVDSERVGGTASVVRYQREGVPATDPCALESPEGFPVYQILTPRQKNPFPQGEVLQLNKLYPKIFQGHQEPAKNYYGKMFARLDEFNQHVVNADESMAADIAKSKKYLLSDVREDELPAGMGAALNRYALADSLAIRFQGWLFTAQVTLHLLTFVAFCLFLTFIHVSPHDPVLLASSALLSAIVVVLKVVFEKKAWNTKHEDYRAMAEGLRVKFFWKLTGIRELIADHYLGRQRSELDWIRNGFRGWNVEESRERHGEPDSATSEEQRNRLAFARKYWIDDQQKYFVRAAERNHKYHERFEYLGYACMIAVVFLAGTLFIPSVQHEERVLGVVAIVLEAFLAAAALLHHFNNRLGYAEHAKQYNRMATLFARGSELLGKFLDREDWANARNCVLKVGIEALTENGDWVLLRRERPLEVPHP